MTDDDLSDEQRGALAGMRAARGPCPPAEALVAYEALGDGERKAHPIHAHVQACSRCQLVLLALAEDSAADTLDDESAADSPGSTTSNPVRSRPRWLPLAAALVIGVAASLLYRRPPADPDVDAVRGAELQVVAPAGSVAAVTSFRWQSPIRAARYRVTVYRQGQVVWTGESVRPELPLSAPLAPGDYEWRVEALDAEGTVRLTSPRTRFSVAP